MKKFIVIKGNIKHPNDANQEIITEQLKNILSSVNNTYQKYFYSNLTYNEDGSFEGILSEGQKTMQIILAIQEGMPVKLRFGVGIGPIEDSLHSSSISLADSALKYAEEIERRKNHFRTNIIIRCDSKILCSVFDSLSSCLYSIYTDWSKNQHAIIINMLMEDKKQKELAIMFGSSQPAINKSIIAGSGHTFIEAISTMNKLIEKVRR